MFKNLEEIRLALFYKFRDKNIPGKVISRLSDYTRKEHMTIRNKQLDSILFLGKYCNASEVDSRIAKNAAIMYVYDHFYCELDRVFYLFEFWYKPYD